MKAKTQIPRPTLIAVSAVLLLTSPWRLSAQVQVLDSFSAGNITVNNSVNSSFGNPVPGVFGENRTILLSKAVESSATSVTVGSGVLTWNGTSKADEGWVGYGSASTLLDLSGYNAFRVTVDSAPQNPGQLEIDFYYYGSPTHIYGVNALATLPKSGTVDVPFSSFVPNAAFPPLDFTQVHGVALQFRGSLLGEGMYVLDNFEAVVVPEPSTLSLFGIGAAGLVARFVRHRRHQS